MTSFRCRKPNEPFRSSQKLVREGDALHQIPSKATFADAYMGQIPFDCKNAAKSVDRADRE
jgi:hypothetical protein